MRMGFWEVFQSAGPGHVTPCVTIEADGLLLRPGDRVSCSGPVKGLDLQPMVDHDVEVEGWGDLLSLRGYYRELNVDLPASVSKPPHREPPVS